MYPHTVTLWCRLGEKDGHAVWGRHVLDGVRFDGSIGESRAVGGDRSERSTMLLVPAAAMGSYISPGLFTGDGWTLRPKDMVAEGDVADDAPPKTAVTVESVKTVRIGSGIHHLEVR